MCHLLAIRRRQGCPIAAQSQHHRGTTARLPQDQGASTVGKFANGEIAGVFKVASCNFGFPGACNAMSVTPALRCCPQLVVGTTKDS